ncbi:SDR family NAD(P)-dependent oxidoreductase [Actinoalloteichus hymeniacidonis]|uniref:Short-chain alcohol dehydrogenase n=1 Tax=Actinoalloteichus hymeniacidonis TaxID=340345 RepID=A0AAC9HTI7_9PSEU|nr:SDR family NAD(P)-dependent oxidoreductase [Actinoalloteichus hymeniacidonis]AOS64656.1 short-chain dehydrogenase of unknown substrate specificity [Actinoalloteichus hymeniacidonis]MBB5907269.1 NAD(P)-dependent dehydrogenase (short-subunit alcohol dehydrogenase family) [Actinoalloteichus hymeniacidonis]
MARTIVITGGTDGIGAALATALARSGDRVVVLGTNEHKGGRLVADAGDSPGTITFVRADLSLTSSTRHVAAELAETHPRIDGLVLGARFFQTRRRITSDGFEHNFALSYLSRLLLADGLYESMARADRPVVVNISGPGQDTPIDWTDLQSARAYDGVRAMSVTGRYNDLLGVDFAQRHGGGPVRYVLLHPGTTSTAFAGEYDPPTADFIRRQQTTAKPAAAVVPPLRRLLDDPPAEPLSAFHLDTRIDLHNGLFSKVDAARLAAATAELLAAPPE